MSNNKDHSEHAPLDLKPDSRPLPPPVPEPSPVRVIREGGGATTKRKVVSPPSHWDETKVASNDSLLALIDSSFVRAHFVDSLIAYIRVHGLTFTERALVSSVAETAMHTGLKSKKADSTELVADTSTQTDSTSLPGKK